ncbi:DUF1365 domain-containing protein [Virgisporangium aurantiacum]|uniref:DUF1365 domain-containing protein n=1 Tax=Virgisporangium aurantiacum TaxID=175570 RepID=UPI0019519589|nr:DUF1365 domain-containing protein [Virgisporangium aurantiacum]
MSAAVMYECVLRHMRMMPVRHDFRYRTYQWLVDLDDLPRLPALLRPLARFEARDHLGDPRATIRSNVDSFLSRHGIDLAGGRVLMLANARVFGHHLNPLTLFWCRHADGTPAAVIAEVHNTYRERHCYLLLPDHTGRAEIVKDFYVSPFFPVDGAYLLRAPEPDGRLAVSVVLRRGDGTAFVASLRGRRRTARTATLVRLALRYPWVTLLASARIRLHGVRLYLRGLPVQSRPSARVDVRRERSGNDDQ